jgi:hypothetical protein
MPQKKIVWCHSKAKRHGALTPDQIASLSDRFDLPEAALQGFAVDLGMALNPPPPAFGILPVFMAKEKTLDEFAGLQRDLDRARSALEKACRRFDHIAFGGESETHPHRDRNSLVRDAVLEALIKLNEAEQEIRTIDYPEDKVEHPDFRTVGPREDVRRRWVLRAIFLFWQSLGRPLGFTTDPITSKRHGELIDFTQAVIRCISDPPGELSAETIVKEISAFKKLDGLPSPFSSQV